MTTIQVPLDKNPDVAALVADLEPGDSVCGCFTIKSKDAQTLELRIEEMAKTPDELSKDEETDGEGDGDETGETAPEKSPEGAENETSDTTAPRVRGKRMAEMMNSASPDAGF